MRLTEQTRYALSVLATLAAHHPRRLRAAELSEATGITAFNIFKLMKTVTKAGFVRSTRGRGGGLALAIAPEALSVGRVVRALEPRFRTCGPAELMARPDGASFPVDLAVDEALGRGFGAFLDMLDTVTIDALALNAQAAGDRRRESAALGAA